MQTELSHWHFLFLLNFLAVYEKGYIQDILMLRQWLSYKDL